LEIQKVNSNLEKIVIGLGHIANVLQSKVPKA
jgi:hypothetical protein